MNTKSYHVSGMTCQNCVNTVTELLKSIPGVTTVNVSLQPPIAEVTTEQTISESILNDALKGRYSVSAGEEKQDERKHWIVLYKPILLIGTYILGLALLRQLSMGNFNRFTFMNDFMAGFFLVFSFFKILDIKGFADSYSMYDIIAKRVKGYAYIYPFLELVLGIAYYTNFHPMFTNASTAIVMGISSIGVLQNVFSEKQIQCACLGTIFQLPVSTVTIIEDLLMFSMSIGMLIIINH